MPEPMPEPVVASSEGHKHGKVDGARASTRELQALTEYPMLSGAGVKGAGIRAMAPWAARIAASLAENGRLQARRADMLKSLVTIYKVVESAELFLEPDELHSFRLAVHSVCSNYGYLARAHMEAGRLRYNLVFKHHYLQHLCDTAATINPLRISTYTEESFVSQGARLYNHGAFGANTQQAVLRKYLVAVQLKFDLQHLIA